LLIDAVSVLKLGLSISMNLTSGTILCLSYILGLLLTAVPGKWLGVPAGGWGLLVLGVMSAISIPLVWKIGPKRWLWLSAGVLGFLATLYFQIKIPQPATNDISQFVKPVEGKAQEQIVIVWGKVLSVPRLTRSSQAQFWLEATNLNEITAPEPLLDIPLGSEEAQEESSESQGIGGKVYVTVPMLQATGLHPGHRVAVTGNLYLPKPPVNPGAFDFQAYLAKEACFAGLRGHQVSWPEGQETGWGWWSVRQRIVRSLVNKLGVPEGPLVSAMVLGRQAVDLPYDIRDQFVQSGLAHTLAASGFHVSLILSLVLALTNRLSQRARFGFGLGVILVFVGLAGASPSVLRAALMGVGALIALVTERTVKPVGTLVLAATILLLFNPVWIWDIGFQLSFLATLGLIVTVPAIVQRLDWIPPTIASLLAVPLAAIIWTLPIQLYVFNVIPTYSILINIISTPFVTLITLGGFISGIIGFVWPQAGSEIASFLYYPAYGLIEIVRFFGKLPGNSVAVGSLSQIQLITIYGVVVGVWLIGWWHKKQRWILAFLFALGIVVVPIWYKGVSLFQVTLLATKGQPVLVIQDQRQVILLNSGDEKTAQFTVLPFLQQQGVNKVDWVVSTQFQQGRSNGWNLILQNVPVQNFYAVTTPDNATLSMLQQQKGNYLPLPVGAAISVGNTSIQLLKVEPLVMQFRILDQNWLLLEDLNPTEQQKLVSTGWLQSPQVLWWSGAHLNINLLEKLHPKVAVAFSQTIDPETADQLSIREAKIYWTGRDGALQWTPKQEFEPMLEATESDAALL
jgi:competence protein ComEC